MCERSQCSCSEHTPLIQIKIDKNTPIYQLMNVFKFLCTIILFFQCEIARMSVLQSGWARKYKLHFLGKDYCDIRETNVANIRLMYRKETLDTEIEILNK